MIYKPSNISLFDMTKIFLSHHLNILTILKNDYLISNQKQSRQLFIL